MTLKLQSVSKSYGQVTALSDINLELYPQEITLLLGENGAGKSTLLRLLAGLDYPDSGDLLYNNQVISNKDGIPYSVGMLCEQETWPERTTVAEFLHLVSRLHGSPQEELRRIVSGTGLEDVENRTISSLSAGTRQRVQFAQALLTNAKVLLLDEPGNGLDPVQFEQMESMLLQEKGNRVILLASHRLKDCEQIADRVLLLRDGRLSKSMSRSDWRNALGHERLRLLCQPEQREQVAAILEPICGQGSMKGNYLTYNQCGQERALRGLKSLLAKDLLPLEWQLGPATSLQDLFFEIHP